MDRDKHRHHEHDDDKLDKKILAELEEQEKLDKHILSELHRLTRPRLSSIKIAFNRNKKKGARPMATQGPVILTTAGEVATATVLGFDQFGAPMPADFVMPKVTFTIDAETFATSVDNGDGTATVTAVANGVANLKADVTSVEGLALTDTETVTVAIVVVPPPTPVLSSIKIAFTTAAAPVAAAAADTRTPNQKVAR